MCTEADILHLIASAAQRRRAVGLASSAGAILGDPIEAIRAGMADPPFWAVIHPSGAVTFAHGKPGLDDLKRAVSGWLEAVPSNAPEDITGYCNEEGKLDGLPINLPATRFFRVEGDILVGPVVVIGGPDHRGEDTALPAGARMRLVSEVVDA